MMMDASGVATRQNMEDGGLVPESIAAPEKLDRGNNLTFVGCSSMGNTSSTLCGKVEHEKGASRGFGP